MTGNCRASLPDAVTARHLEERIRAHVRYTLVREWEDLEPSQLLQAVALAVRDLLAEGALETERRVRAAGAKRIYYLSIEYLIGRSLSNNLRNLGLYDLCRTTLKRLGVDLGDLLECEPDAALGNGGLGRLAACFLDSMATLGYAGMGYGINYEHGLFRQEIVGGGQVERPESWRSFGSPWLIMRPEEAVAVPLYGRVVHQTSPRGRYRPVWTDWRLVLGVPSDLPIVGYGGRTVTSLRLYAAHSSEDLDLVDFDRGAYLKAVEERIQDETISQVLYPSDAAETGRELRLRQECFFVACAVRDIVRRYEAEHSDMLSMAEHVAIQMNDTHPALAVPELMRLLVDDHGVEWDQAWNVVQGVFGYTNHTLMPEALEYWPVALLERVVPRHLHIIYEINRRFVDQVRARWPGDGRRVERMSMLQTDSEPRIRMANLCVVGSHTANGVSKLHSELLGMRLFPDFREMWPDRFQSKTNGVTPRRWVLGCNRPLSRLLDEVAGPDWVTDMARLRVLEPLADDPSFRDRFDAAKRANKARLATYIAGEVGESVDPGSIFDIHVKRIHEYKRQLLNLLRIAHEYLHITEDGVAPLVSRTYVFAGKAAIGYDVAKNVIRAILGVAAVVNRDPRSAPYMRVVFLPDYRVSLAERIMPAADVSEQISTAGMEASGTGNMKMAMNGALTLGTRDGANIEIRDAVGAENVFEFGLTADEAIKTRADGSHRPREILDRSPGLRRVMDRFESGFWCPRSPDVSRWVYRRLVDDGDEFLVLGDFDAYVRAQDAVSARFADRGSWLRSAILNVARMEYFSSDRAIHEYARDIWGAEPAESDG